jgi:hypothetical protein
MNGKVLAIAIALLVVAMVVAPGAARQADNPWQAGASPIHHFDVAATDGHGSGRLTIDLERHTFVFNGLDFTPSAQVELGARAAANTDYVVFATGKATPSGNLHVAGTWEAASTPASVSIYYGYPCISAFDLYNKGWFVAQLACYYSTDGGDTWHESGHVEGIANGRSGISELGDLGVPADAVVKIHAVVVGGKDRTGSELFQYVPSRGQYAHYWISGVTWKPSLSYQGLVGYD